MAGTPYLPTYLILILIPCRSFADTASQSSIDSAYNSSIAALCFGIVCFLFDFFGKH